MNDLSQIIVLIIFFAACMFLLYLLGGDTIIFFKSRQKPVDTEPEKKIAAGLRRLAAVNGYTILTDITLMIDGDSAHIDALLIGEFGVVVLQACGMAGDLYGDEKDPTWIQRFGGQRINFENPFSSLPPATRLVRSALFTAGIRPKVLDSFVVFTARKVSVNLPKSAPYIMCDNIRASLDKSRYLESNGLDIAVAVAAIEKFKI